MRKSHAAQHIRRLGELNILVPDDLYAVAPRVEKVEKRSGEGLDARVAQCLASGLLVIDHKSKVTPIVGGLCTALLECEELVTQIDERHGIAFASKFEIEQAGIESQSRFDVADFESDVIEPDDARFFCFRHGALHSEAGSIRSRGRSMILKIAMTRVGIAAGHLGPSRSGARVNRDQSLISGSPDSGSNTR